MIFTFVENSFCGKFCHIVNVSNFKLLIALLCLTQTCVVYAIRIDIQTPSGTISIDVSHAGPSGQLVEPSAPVDAGFQAPTIFASPLPVGSGARALGQAGAFTAVADDATAASWNPAGLIQLETPEVSAVYRFSGREDRHGAQSDDVEVHHDQYFSSELNYLSTVYPFLVNGVNAEVSLNYQETYDFTHEFSAVSRGKKDEERDTIIWQKFVNVSTNNYVEPYTNITVFKNIITETESRIDQVFNSGLLTDIEFRQSGTIDALSPALAFEISPTLSVGFALNLYTDGASRGNPIESTVVANYEGPSDRVAQVTDERSSTVDILYTGVFYGGAPYAPIPVPIYETVKTNFSDVATSTQEDQYLVDGNYREQNNTEDFHGINATLGALWTLSEKLTLGATVDLPWTGQGNQTKRIHHEVTTFDHDGVEVAQNKQDEIRRSDVEYTFPLYWSIGGLWRWSDRLYTSVDISQTLWSDFSYTAGSNERINPLNGKPHDSSASDDCLALRLGGEYLWVLSWTEMPLRGGLFWEERPAAGAPDEYWGFSLGTGLSLGRLILDIAYIYEQGNNVMASLLPDESTRTDSSKHQIFISGIWHF